MRLFQLVKNGLVLAEGVIFDNDKTVVRWLGGTQSIVVWDKMEDFHIVSVFHDTERHIIYLN